MSKASEFKSKRILVIGDLILDDYIRGNVDRISPEAPVPVIHAQGREFTAGGAANVVKNIRGLGARCLVAGLIGEDDDGRLLREVFNHELGVEPEESLLLSQPGRPTIKKTRILGNSQQICRIDWEDTTPITSEETEKILDFFRSVAGQLDGIIISDYGKGVITAGLMTALTAECRARNIPVGVDPHVSHYDFYKGVSFLTPNHLEAGAGAGMSIKTEEDLIRAGAVLMKRLEPDCLVITRGKDGMALFHPESDRPDYFPTIAKQVFDVTGAGDTVISVFTLARAAGLDWGECCRLSNRAGGLVVAKLGAVGITPEELFGGDS